MMHYAVFDQGLHYLKKHMFTCLQYTKSYHSPVKPFLHEYSSLAPPTMNNYMNYILHWYIEQRNYMSGPLV